MPDSLTVWNGAVFGGPTIFQKDGLGYYSGTGSGFKIAAQVEGWFITQIGNDSEAWELNVETPQCLLGIWPAEGDCAEDFFAFSYMLKIRPNSNFGVPLTRVSLCTWEFTDFDENGELIAHFILTFKGRHDAKIEDLIAGRSYIRDPLTGDTTPKGAYIEPFDNLTFSIL